MTYNTHYKSSCTSTGQRDRKIDHYTNLTVGGVTSGTYSTRPPCRSLCPTRAEVPPPDPNSTTPTADLRGRTRGIRPSGRAPTPSQDDRGQARAQGPEPAVLTQRTRRQAESIGQAPNLTLTFLALEGGPMLQERLFGNSGADHHPEPNHPQPTEEATVAVPTLNRFWRIMTDPGFPSPTSNPTPFVVTTEAFLDLTSQKEVLKSRGEDGESSTGSSPFTPEIQAKPLPATFRLPALEPYDGSGDSTEHIVAFCTQMALYDTSDALMCQGIQYLHRSLAIQAFLTGLRPSRFFWSLIERPPTTMPEMLQRAHQYVAAEMLVACKREETKCPRGEQSRGYLTPSPKRREDRSSMLLAKPPHSPQFNSNRDLFHIRERGLLKAPNPMKSHPERRDKRRYCCFHREYEYDTEECHDLQYQIEDLIRRGHLRRYVREQSSLPDGRPPRDSSPRPKGPVEKQIDVIFDGPASGGNSSSTRKAYARSEVGKRLLHDEDLD
ncbi:hypothetical protein B296_00011781, partial [Ensete ventricosum]